MILTADPALMTRTVCRNKGILKASSVIRLCFADLAEPEYDQEKQEKVPVIIDLSQAEYISSAGLRSVLKMAKVCNSQKIRFLVCGIQPPVYEVFRISGFTSLLTIKNTRQEALDAL